MFELTNNNNNDNNNNNNNNNNKLRKILNRNVFSKIAVVFL